MRVEQVLCHCFFHHTIPWGQQRPGKMQLTSRSSLGSDETSSEILDRNIMPTIHIQHGSKYLAVFTASPMYAHVTGRDVT